MNRRALLAATLLMIIPACTSVPPETAGTTVHRESPRQNRETRTDGERLFRQFCASCHPDGGNVSDPARSLHKAALKARRITTPDDIVRIMRQPASRMIAFDRSSLPDEEAFTIAAYILKTY